MAKTNEVNDKDQILSQVLSDIEKQFGKGAIMKLGSESHLEVDSVSSGSLSLDIALGIGGYPKGRIVEIYGPESSGKTTFALHAIAEIQKQENTEKTLKIESTQEMKFQSMITGKTFVTVTEDATLVMEAADENSVSIGKVYRDSVVKITERGDIFSKIESGNVVGYVKTETLITGKDAVAHAKVILTEVYPEMDILTLTKEQIDAAFSVGETAEEEAARLAAEEAARVAAEQARIAAGYTQEQLAEAIDTSTQFLSDAERGVTGMSLSASDCDSSFTSAFASVLLPVICSTFSTSRSSV